jgi:predicted Zn-dependent protease
MSDVPPNPYSLFEQAHESALAKQYARAEQLLAELLTQAPNHLLGLDLLGYVLFFQNRPAEAEAACRKALAIEPERAYSTKGLGLCVARQGHVDEGCRLLREAIRLAPAWFDPRWDLAVVLADAARWDEAEGVLLEAEAAIPQEKARYSAFRERIVTLCGEIN